MRSRQEVMADFRQSVVVSTDVACTQRAEIVNNQRLILEALLDIRDQREVKIEYIKELLKKFVERIANGKRDT